MNELIKVSLTTFGNDEVNSINDRDPRFGRVNTYPVSVLEDIIKVGPHDGKPCLGPGCPYCDEDEAM